MMARSLPPQSSLSPYAREFLHAKLSSQDDLTGGAGLLCDLRHQSHNLGQTLSELKAELMSHLTRHSSNSDRVESLFSSVSVQLEDLRRISGRPMLDAHPSRGMGDELQALAREMSRVETMRNYAETTLKLEILVADAEDAVSSCKTRALGKLPTSKDLEDVCAVALRTLKQAEYVLTSVVKMNPQWVRLVSAVDHRIDRALAILRPQAIADHRALLTSLGWPPPLLKLNSSNPDMEGSADVKNPLLTMQGNLKVQYCESFLALCSIQELQRRRKSRQLQGHSINVSLYQPLWVTEELVNPIVIASQHHFSKWIQKPEYIFALVYKITREYVDSMDDLLQPLVDESLLSGYSCREEWISAMVSALSAYLVKEVFPLYISHPQTENEAQMSLLHLVDLMIEFDKRVQSLAANSGIVLSVEEYTNLEKISSLSVFCHAPEWLDLWAEAELADTLDKLNPEMENERNWIDTQPLVSQLSGEIDNKCPLISAAVIRCLTSLIDHCRALPGVKLRYKFVRLTVGPVINKFLECLVQRCVEAEGLTALTDDNSLTKVAQSINTAHHFESVLKEFCEDIFFLEMVSESENNIFFENMKKLQGFRTEWVEKLCTVILRGFDAICRDYIKNKKQWQEKNDDVLTVSRSFIEAMDYLHKKLSIVEEGLNKKDFTRVWRSVAAAVDKFIFSNVLLSNVKFHDRGVERLGNDLTLLFGVFGGWCIRAEGFFPKTSESLKLLKMETQLVKISSQWLKNNGIKHLNALEVEKILKSRMLSS